MYGPTSSPAHPSSEAEKAPALLARLDALFGSVADADELVRAAAGVAGCTAGLTDEGRVVRRSPAGGAPDGVGPVLPSTRRSVTVDGHTVGEVWVERPGAPLPSDALLTERMALEAAMLVVGGGSGGGARGRGAVGLGRSGRGPRPAPRSGGRGPGTRTDAASGGDLFPVPDNLPDTDGHRAWWPAGLGDPALVQAVLSQSMPETQRSRALHLLGLPPVGPLRAATVVVAEPADLQAALRACAAQLHGPPSARTGGTAPHGALWSRVGAILLPGAGASGARSGRGGARAATGAGPGAGGGPAREPLAVPRGVAVGLGPAMAPERLPESWEQARRAARFADLGPTWPRLVDATELGAQVLLADIPEDVALTHPDVVAVARLEAEPDGPQMLATLEAVCRTRSLREAAKLVSLHHSSVAHRVVRAERALAMSLSDPSERQRAHTAVLLWRLNAPDNWRH